MAAAALHPPDFERSLCSGHRHQFANAPGFVVVVLLVLAHILAKRLPLWPCLPELEGGAHRDSGCGRCVSWPLSCIPDIRAGPLILTAPPPQLSGPVSFRSPQAEACMTKASL